MEDEGFRHFFYTARDGLQLHARVYGTSASGTLPVICLPGLTRNAADFHEFALTLSRDERRPRQVVAFDYRGRGLSARDPDWRNYSVPVESRDINDGLTILGIHQAAFIGTSRGGMIIMALAASRPAVIRAVVLNDIGPVLEGSGLAHIRSYLQNAPQPSGFTEAVQLLKRVHGNAFPTLAERDWERHANAIYRAQADGRLVQDFDPKLLKVLKAIDLNVPLPTLWPQFSGLAGVPVLAIRGANSLLLSKNTLAEMAARHPRLETLTVDGQGHAPFLETGVLPSQIAAFLTRAERDRAAARHRSSSTGQASGFR